MANEATIAVTVTIAKGGVVINQAVSAKLDVATTVLQATVQTIGTADETLSLGDVGTLQSIILVNQDPTNYVEIDVDNTFTKFPQKLYPAKAGASFGPPVILSPETNTIHAKAHTGSCNILIIPVPV